MHAHFSFASTMPAVKTLKNTTYRHKKTRCPIGSTEHPREEFEPSIIAIHDKMIASHFQLCEPGVLICERRGRI